MGGVWGRASPRTVGGDGPGTTPAGPGRSPLVPSLYRDLADCPPTAKGTRLRSIFNKVSQNDEVSPKSHEKASHSPYIQNGLQKSPLEILRFPLTVAFSHKELMGHFDAGPGVYCQNDEVSPVVHTLSHAKWTSDTPTGPASKLAPGTRSSSD